jgi:hypothetical protein
MTRELLIPLAGLWLTVSLKCVVIHAIAALISTTWARHRPAWRSFIWMAALASFPGLTVLEWTGAGSNQAAAALFTQVPYFGLSIGVHAYGAISLILLGLILHSAVRLRLLRSYSAPLGVRLDSIEGADRAELAEPPVLLKTAELLRNGHLNASTSFGVLRPVIVLPDSPIGTTYSHFVQAALVHELIKVLRFDALWTLLARLVQCGWFAHPLAWRAFRHYCLAREQVCDRWTVRATRDVSGYELHLLALTRSSHRRGPMSLDMPMDWTGPCGIRARITDLQNYQRAESLQPWPTVAATVVWMLLLALLAAIGYEPTASSHGLMIHILPMLMGAAGALSAGAALALVILIARARRARLTPPVDGVAGRSRQTLADCVQRLEREWQDLQSVISATARRFEPLVLMLIVVVATVGFWLMAGSSDEADGWSVPPREARIHDANWP